MNALTRRFLSAFLLAFASSRFILPACALAENTENAGHSSDTSTWLLIVAAIIVFAVVAFLICLFIWMFREKTVVSSNTSTSQANAAPSGHTNRKAEQKKKDREREGKLKEQAEIIESQNNELLDLRRQVGALLAQQQKMQAETDSREFKHRHAEFEDRQKISRLENLLEEANRELEARPQRNPGKERSIKEQKISNLKKAAKVFIWLGMIFNFYLIFPIVIGIFALQKIDTAKSRDELMWWSIATLFLCNLIGGILMLCIKDDDLKSTYSTDFQTRSGENSTQTPKPTQNDPPPLPVRINHMQELTDKTYHRLLSQFADIKIKYNVEFELISIMYITADFALCSQKKYGERQKFSEDFTAIYKKYFNYSTAEQDFDNSNDFYAQFLNGKEARAEFFFFEPPETPCTGIIGALVAFGDVLCHPGIKNDYDKSGIFLHGLTEVTEFRQFFMNTVVPTLLDYGRNIANVQKVD